MADEALDKLKGKYQSVLNKMNQLGARLENLHVQNGKLVLRGRAKTKADADEVWNQIKLVDAQYADLQAEIGFDSAGVPVASAAPPRTYTVKKGDTLSEIAANVYGDAGKYRKIFEANKDKLSDPDEIQPGQVLTLPA